MIHPAEFSDSIASAVMVEMSVVLREQDRGHDKKCPRCDRVNVSSVIDRGWTEWEVPLTYIIVTDDD